MSGSHTLIRLDSTARLSLCPSITRTGPQLNFGEVASIPLSFDQAVDVAKQLQAWIDERMAAAPPPSILKV